MTSSLTVGRTLVPILLLSGSGLPWGYRLPEADKLGHKLKSWDAKLTDKQGVVIALGRGRGIPTSQERFWLSLGADEGSCGGKSKLKATPTTHIGCGDIWVARGGGSRPRPEPAHGK